MDPHSFIARAEAQRWIGIAEKLLISHDLVGSKTFAIRARESDPRLEAADQILAIADTLLAAEKRVVGSNGNQQPDYYAILQLVRFVQDTDHITSQYRRLAVVLNPHQNRFPYSDQAFQLVNDAWAVLSNPMRKSIYDSELDFAPQQQISNLGFNIEQQQHQQQHQQHQQQQQHQHNFFSIHEQEMVESPQQFENRPQRGGHQQHNFLAQPNAARPQQQEQMFHHREQEQMYQSNPVQPFQVTSPSRHQQINRPSPQGSQVTQVSIQSPTHSVGHHREQEHVFKQQVQPFQVTNLPQQGRSTGQAATPIQSPPRAASVSSGFSWPQAAPQMSQAQLQAQEQQKQMQIQQEQQKQLQIKQEQQKQLQMQQEQQKQLQLQQEQQKLQMEQQKLQQEQLQRERQQEEQRLQRQQEEQRLQRQQEEQRLQRQQEEQRLQRQQEEQRLLQEQRLQQEQRQKEEQRQQEERLRQEQWQQQQHEQQQQQQHQEPVIPNVPPVQLPNEVNTNNGSRQEEAEPEQEPEAEAEVEPEEIDEEVDDSPTFWTTCPFCFYMYEYPKVYADCTLRCEHCQRAFQAVSIPSPPPIAEGQEAYFYSWGYFPIGVSMSHLQKNSSKGTTSRWTPFSPLFDASSNVQNHLNECAAPKENTFVNKSSGPRIYFDDYTDDVFIGISESSDDSDIDWASTEKRKVKRVKNVDFELSFKQRVKVLGLRAIDPKNGSYKNLKNGFPVKDGMGVTAVLVAETIRKTAVSNPRKQPGQVAKELGKLDLNVEFDNNEGEEPASRLSAGTRVPGDGEEDNIEGIGFFEGLDEFLNSLPILSAVNEEKVEAA
uniref:transcription factor SPT20 homolog n=1 Tax=Erigeron canadensis TaxID=72917 RepID=UPI001CB95155|nr:transcription factor SPT20 homolog [Erigeron canadensis]